MHPKELVYLLCGLAHFTGAFLDHFSLNQGFEYLVGQHNVGV